MKQFAAIVGFLLFFSSLFAQRVITAPGAFADIAYVPARDALYAVRPAFDADGNTLCRIDPETGAVLESYAIGPDPERVVATTSGDYVYVSYRGDNRIQRFSLLTKRVDLDFTVGGNEAPNGPYYASDLLPVRGSDDLLVVARRSTYTYPSAVGTVLFDQGRLLPGLADGPPAAKTLAYSDRDDVVIGYDNEGYYQLQQISVSASGLEATAFYGGLYVSSGLLEYAGKRLYAPSGEIASVNDGVPNPVTTLGLEGIDQSGTVAVEADSTNNRLYYLGTDYYTGQLRILAFNRATLRLLFSRAIDPFAPLFTGVGATELEQLGGKEDFAFLTSEQTLGLLRLCSGAGAQEPPPYAGPTTICKAEPLAVTVPEGTIPPGGTVEWSDGRKGDTIYVDVSGEYSYRIVDADGCPGPVSPSFYLNESYYGDVVPVIQDPLTRVLCTGTSLTLTAESPIGTPIVWNTGDTTPVLTVTEPGTYIAYTLDPESVCLSSPSAPMEISAVDAVPPPAPTVEQGLVIDTCTLRPIELSVSDFAQEYFWTFENAYTEQSSTASDAITVYPNYEPIQFTVRTKYFNDCLSPPTRGRLTFLSPPDAPSIQYDAATTTLAASVAGPILWYYQDELEAETPGRYYKPKYNGFYTARVKGPSCLSDFSNQVVVGGITTAVRDEEASAQVRIFPVPSRDVVHVTIDAGLVHQLPQGMLEYQLFASNGQRVAGGQLDPRLPGTPIPVAGLPAGLYLLTFEHQGKAVLRKRVTVL